ncbi:MAG: hypothetical protein IJ064_05770 [Bacteroidaceae bacterium]|nr:hypothetical protein [Bacteroidaceae bacterium]
MTKEYLTEKLDEIFGHIGKAKEELERMNVGKAHDELSLAQSITIEIDLE